MSNLTDLLSRLLPHVPLLLALFILLLSAAAAVTLRNLIHCALCITLSFLTLGIVFIALGAEFLGLAQILIYVGAVAVLMVFAILLTRPADIAGARQPFLFNSGVAGVLVGGLVLAGLLSAIFLSPLTRVATPPRSEAPVVEIGKNLVGNHLLPLQATGVLLTAALIGAAVLSRKEGEL